MQKIKIGQIGVCHEHAEGKILSLRKMPDIFEIVGVVDDRLSPSAKFAGGNLAPYEGLKWMTEEELFKTPGLQAITVETPNDDLVPTALRCLEQNLPIHLDKPGGADYEAFCRLRQGYASRGLPFQMGYMFRGNPAFNWIRRALHKGWLGDVFEIQASMSHNYGGEEYQTYLGKLPGGIMFNLGCHLIDSVVALLGRPTGVTSFLKSAPGDPDCIKNNGVAILEYPHATVTLRACSREVSGLNVRRLKVCGTTGTVELCPLERFDGHPLQMQLTLQDGNDEQEAGTHTLEFGPVRDRYESELRDFARFIRGEAENPYDGVHDCLVEEVLLAAAGQTPWRQSHSYN